MESATTTEDVGISTGGWSGSISFHHEQDPTSKSAGFSYDPASIINLLGCKVCFVSSILLGKIETIVEISRGLTAARIVRCCGKFRNGILTLLSSDRKSTRLNSSHQAISYAVFCL